MKRLSRATRIDRVPESRRWGQFDTEGIVELVRRLDPDRLVNSASGVTYDRRVSNMDTEVIGPANRALYRSDR